MADPDAPLQVPDGAEPAWLSKLSHDLRNQLAPMRTATQLLLRGRLDAEHTQEMLEVLDRQVLRIVRMCDDLAEYGRARAPRTASARERLDLGILVDTALGEAGRRIEAAGLTLHSDVEERRLPVDGERQRLTRVFLRLFDNAIRFTPRGGTLRLRVRADGDVGEVSLRDDGEGMDAERLRRLFALPDAMRGPDGLGISLLLSRHCIEQHGGTLDAASDGPGRGSEFVVRLPLAAAQPSSASQRA